MLDRLGNPAADAPRQALDETGIVHFMSLSVVPDTAPGQAHMMLELSADGGPAEALTAVCDALRPTIATRSMRRRSIAAERTSRPSCCGVISALGPAGGDTTGLGFSGVPFMSVWRILNEARIVDEIAMMPALGDATMSASHKLERVREHLWDKNEKWAFAGEPAPFLTPGLARTHSRDLWMLAYSAGASFPGQ